MKPQKRTKRRGRRLTRRLYQALEQADVDRDERQDELLLRKLATRQQALALATVPLPARWPQPAPGLAGGSTIASLRATTANRAEIPGSPPSKVAGDNAAHRAARPQRENRPHQPARTATSSEPKPGEEPPDGEPGNAARAESNRPGPKPRATRDLLTEYAHRLHRDTGRLSRDLLENAVREAGYSVASDTAGEVVRSVKADLRTGPAGHPQ